MGATAMRGGGRRGRDMNCTVKSAATWMDGQRDKRLKRAAERRRGEAERRR